MAESIAGVVADLYAALTRGDVDWVEGRLALDPTAVHVGPASRYWMTPDELVAELRRQFAEVTLEWTAGPLAVAERGDVAWVADRPTIGFDDGSELTVRVSLVLVRENGTWKLAHSHVSST